MESSFGAYCMKEAIRQRQNGYVVPTSVDSYDFHHWEQEARRRCGLVGSQGNQSAFLRKIDCDANLLVDEVAKCGRTGASRNVPHSFGTEHELTAFLSSLEVLLRVFFLDSSNEALLVTLQKFRENFTDLQKKKVIGLEYGKYPEIYVLYELFSLRKLLLNWKGMTPENQKVITRTAMSYMAYVRSPEYAILGDLLGMAEKNLSSVAVNTIKMVKCLDQACGSTPYAFPHICQFVLSSVCPRHSCPSGTLTLKGSATQKGETTGVDTAATADVANPMATEPSHTRKRARNADDVTKGETSTETDDQVAAEKRQQCASKYHSRYSAARRFASKGCRFCGLCHMMEILFNGCTLVCNSAHGPTEWKISSNLKRYPEVCTLALRRFKAMQRGVVLKPCEDIPLS